MKLSSTLLASFLSSLFLFACGAPDTATTSTQSAIDSALSCPNGAGLEAACVTSGSAWGNGLSTQFGRLDGTLTAIATPGSSQCNQSNPTHLVIELTANGAPYPLVLNVNDARSGSPVDFGETDAALVGEPWQQGWHTDSGEHLDYANNLNVHSDAFTPYGVSDLVNKVVCELTPGDNMSIYALGWGSNGAHDIHRNTGGGGADGAVVIHADQSTVHYMMFHFANQSF
jgi:hypothetical protein